MSHFKWAMIFACCLAKSAVAQIGDPYPDPAPGSFPVAGWVANPKWVTIHLSDGRTLTAHLIGANESTLRISSLREERDGSMTVRVIRDIPRSKVALIEAEDCDLGTEVSLECRLLERTE